MDERGDREHDARWDAVAEATELMREGDSEAAARELRGVLDRDPGNPYAHYFLGALRFEQGEFEAARASYCEALGHAPGYLGALVGMGHALRMLGRTSEAIAAGERAVAMAGGEGGDPDAHYLLGLSHAARGDASRAITHLEAFLASKPELEVRYEVEALIESLQSEAAPLKPVS